ncbi:hypothetical protein sos41_13660 [Alphaproteobacteria bacterium SO-S41]|nr:hypothetical protein sos41_13660 [Alphaproteobacteria bacterium SO-S41]
MRANSFVVLQFSLMIDVLVFGIAAAIVVSVPALNTLAYILLPLIVMAALVATPFTAWWLAPRMGRRHI